MFPESLAVAVPLAGVGEDTSILSEASGFNPAICKIPSGISVVGASGGRPRFRLLSIGIVDPEPGRGIDRLILILKTL